MAIIGDIRRNAGLLIGLIGFSLAAFILGDVLTNNSFLFRSDVKGVATIKGNNIDPREFESKVLELEEVYKLNNESPSIDETTRDQLREQGWTELLNDEILGDQFNRLGINVGSDELADMITGENPHPQVRQAFTNPQTGQFDKNTVVQYLQQLNTMDARSRQQWFNFEKAILKERERQKYDNLIGKSVFINKHELNQDLNAKNTSADILIAKVDYSAINDADVEVTQENLNAVYNENKLNYKQDASAKLEYVRFDIVPSEEDIAEARDYIYSRVDAYKNAENDSIYAVIHADSRFNNTYLKKGTISPALDSIVFNVPKGHFIGPYEEEGYFKMAKVFDVINFPDSVKARHILITYTGAERANPNVTRSPQQAKALADSLYEAIQETPGSFDNLARNFSDGPTRTKGGDLGWFRENMMATEFNDFCFTNTTGKTGLVQTVFGFHIINITGQGGGEKRVRMAIVDREIQVSQNTRNKIYGQATKFAGENRTGDKFNAAATEQNIAIRTAPNVRERDKNLPGLTNMRQLVRWAFTADLNSVSGVEQADEAFVVAKLVERIDNGIPPLEKVKGAVEAEARKIAKANKIKEQSANINSVEQFAKQFGGQVDTIQALNFGSPFLPGMGSEPGVVGALFSLQQGETSSVLEGDAGVYMAKIISKTQAPTQPNFVISRKQLEQAVTQRAKFEVFNALKESADVTDNRGKIY